MFTPTIVDAVFASVLGHGGLAQGLSGLKSLVWLIPYLLFALVYVLCVAVGLAALIAQMWYLRKPIVSSTAFYMKYGRFLFFFSLVMGFVGVAILLIALIADGIPESNTLWKSVLFLFLPYAIGGLLARLMIWLARLGTPVASNEKKSNT